MKISKLWQWVKQHPVISIFIMALAIFLVISLIGGYFFNWSWTGFSPYTSPPHPTNTVFQREKTLWDWLQLLIIPVVLAIGGFWLNQIQRSREETDKERETALQNFLQQIDRVKFQRGELRPEAIEFIRVAIKGGAQGLFAILDPNRNGRLLQSLYDYNFIREGSDIIIEFDSAIKIDANLAKARLTEAHLVGINLTGADLSGADLSSANLSSANLSNADLSHAKLMSANLKEANLSSVNLMGANLKGARDITDEELEAKAKSLQGATMTKGSKYS